MIAEMSMLTGQPQEKLRNELRRDFYLTAPEAAAYGVVDKVSASPPPALSIPPPPSPR